MNPTRPFPVSTERQPRAAFGLAVLAACCAAVPAAAQGDGEMLQPAPRAPGDPFAVCATEAYLPGGGAETSCDVIDAVDLGAAVESWLLRYRRVAEVPDGEAVAVVDLEEFAVIEASGGGYRVVWRNSVDTRFDALSLDGIASLGDATVVSYTACVRTAGGCAPRFLIRDGAGWGIVEQPYVAELAGHLPEGWSLQEGRRIDLASMTGTQPLIGPADGDCCPRGEIAFAVALQGRSLVLRDATVSVPEPEPADSAGEEPTDSAGADPPDGPGGGQPGR